MSRLLKGCDLCDHVGGAPVWEDERLRVVRVEDDAFPAFYRVIWHAHVGELSDLARAEREHCLAVVVAVERALRATVQPTKVNVASLGNVTPHLHWHVIARFDWDSHWPGPIWAAPKRVLDAPAVQRLAVSLFDLDRAVAAALPPGEQA